LPLQAQLLRSLKRLQLTSSSFTTLDADQLDDVPFSQSDETVEGPGQSDEPVTPIGQKPSAISKSDETTQTDISVVDSDKLLSMLQQETYKSSMCVDSLSPSAEVPFQQDAEVMVVVDSLPHHRRFDPELEPSSQKFAGRNQRLFRSTLEMVSSRAPNGRMTLTPVVPRSVGGQSEDQGSAGVIGQRSLGQQAHQSMFSRVSFVLCCLL